MNRSPKQLDFFREPVFPIHDVEAINIERFCIRLKKAMTSALRECPFERAIAAKILALQATPTTIKRGQK